MDDNESCLESKLSWLNKVRRRVYLLVHHLCTSAGWQLVSIWRMCSSQLQCRQYDIPDCLRSVLVLRMGELEKKQKHSTQASAVSKDGASAEISQR
ncbi:unnamed protein product [Larinioides sclopetarius]|uniref:Uncharacterized protein n=1 Tax=Larinioides sclopetarius TaxID=280406 RepID=A0AAV1ZN85_9ARAC